MYANQSDFESWMLQQLPVMCSPPYRRRFVSVYTDSGGTLQLNQDTADAVALWPEVDETCLLDDRSTHTLAPQQCASIAAHRVCIFTALQVRRRHLVQAKCFDARPSS